MSIIYSDSLGGSLEVGKGPYGPEILLRKRKGQNYHRLIFETYGDQWALPLGITNRPKWIQFMVTKYWPEIKKDLESYPMPQAS